MNIAILGASGQLGQSLQSVAQHYPEMAITAFGREVDITQPGLVAAALTSQTFDVVINCAAYNQVDLAETELKIAEQVNHLAVRYLGDWVKRNGAFLIHFSTDYVFDGLNQKPYIETDHPAPLNIYGQSKLNGEQALLAINSPGLVIRTSWLFSPFGQNFFTKMCQLAQSKPSIHVVSDQIGSPTSALDLATAVFEVLRFRQTVLQQNLAESANHQAWCSMQRVHFANQGQTSWAELAAEIIQQQNVTCQVLSITTADFSAKAQRPSYSVLNTEKIQAWLPAPIQHWRYAVTDIKQWF